MTLKKNIIANYISQIYVALVGVVMLPTYLSYMGAEAYGLVGFYAMLQVWFSLLDVGLSSTFSRQVARFRGGALSGIELRQLLHGFEAIFFIIAALIVIVTYSLSNNIALQWLNVELLDENEVVSAIQIMSFIIALRWCTSLYRSTISGCERFVWLSGFNSFIATLRFVLVIPVFVFIGTSPTDFFIFQLAVATIELAVLFVMSYRLMPNVQRYQVWNFKPILKVYKFSLTIAFTAAVWVVATQVDKLILSNLIKLSEYGYFSIAVLVASVIVKLGAPISNAILPRMSRLEAEGDSDGVIRLYKQGTQLVTVVTSSVTLTLVMFAEELLLAWTGDKDLSQYAASILILYAVGNSLLVLAAFPYYLQYAKGNLKYHLIGNIWFVLVLIPLMIWAVNTFGAIGAGYCWLGVNIFFIAAWVPIVHSKIVPNLNRQWFLNDILKIVLTVIPVAWLISILVPSTDSRMVQLLLVAISGVVLFAVAVFASSTTRGFVRRWL